MFPYFGSGKAYKFTFFLQKIILNERLDTKNSPSFYMNAPQADGYFMCTNNYAIYFNHDGILFQYKYEFMICYDKRKLN